MARKTSAPVAPLDPEAAARYWRARAERLEEQVAQLRAALRWQQAIAAGKPVPSIVRARKPKPRWS